MGGLALSFSRNPRQYFRTLKAIGKDYTEIKQQALKNAIIALYKSKMIEQRENNDGSLTIVLTENGRKKALTYQIDEMKIKEPQKWDKKWRIVLFDIPEKKKKTRETLRHYLNNLNFFEYQKSVFVHPYDCKNEIEYIIEFYDIRKYVRFITADSLDNELHLINHFKLN